MATDQEIRDAGFKYIPQQKYLQNPFQIPTTDDSGDGGGGGGGGGGIPFTNAGNNFNPAGNMFGEGTAVSPVFGNSYIDTVRREGPDSFAAYDKLSQAGGTAPAGMYTTDYFPGTENELADAMGRMPGQENYDPSMNYSEDAFQKAEDKRGFLSKLMNNAKQKMTGLPDWAQAAITTAGILNPFTAIPKLLGMSGGDGGPNYGIAGLSDSKKGAYDALASSDMLFKTPGGYKTLTGKNFQAKNYISNQLEIYDKLKDIDEDDLTGWQKKQLLESTAIFNTDKEALDLEGKIRLGGNLVQDTTYQSDPQDSQTGIDNYTGPGMAFEAGNTDQGGGVTGGQVQDMGGVPGGRYGSPRKDGGLMYANGGRAGYFYGGRIGFQGGGSDASSDDFVTSTSTPGPGDTGGEGGTNPSDGSDTQFGGGNNDGENNNPPVTVVNNPVDISTVTKSVGDYEIPYGLEALISDKGRLQAVLNADNVLNKNLGLDFTYDQGPYQIGFNADMEGNKNLGLSYNKGNLSAYANTNFNDPSVGFKYSRAFAYGGLASLL